MTTNRYTRTVEERFWQYVDKLSSNECWNWKGVLDPPGYGCLQVNGKAERMHRYSYRLHNGPIKHGLYVLHSCDNRKCVNPNHLRLGTHQDNIKDRVDRGRNAPMKGSINPRATIDEKIAIEIYNEKLPVIKIAQKFEVSYWIVYNIKQKKTWTHIHDTF